MINIETILKNLEIYGDTLGGFSGSYNHPEDEVLPCRKCPFCHCKKDLELKNTHSPSYTIRCPCGAEMHAIATDWDGGKILTKNETIYLHIQAIYSIIDKWNKR